MILNKRELALKLGVSERALTTWRRQGMPIAAYGRRGQESAYDLLDVLLWVRDTRNPVRVKIDVAALERELGIAPAPAAVQMSAPRLTEAEEHAISVGPGLETALLSVPAVAARAGVTEPQIDALLEGLLKALRDELVARGMDDDPAADEAEAYRTMLAEERAQPGSWIL